MAPSLCIELQQPERRRLLEIARESIQVGLGGSNPLQVAARDLSGALSAPLGVFVTLSLQESLRGCIGSIESDQALAQSVADSAYNAAFHDPRFPRLQPAELPCVCIEVSVLSAPEPVEVADRAQLLSGLRPGLDGLLLEDGPHRSTFLPKVWEQLPEPEDFLSHLLCKAGLPPDHWSATLRFHRYHALGFAE